MSHTQFPRAKEQHGPTENAPGPIPDDLDTRGNLRRFRLPELAKLGTVIDVVAAPAASTAATAASGAETFDMSAFPALEITIDEYQGIKSSSGSVGTLRSGLAPARSTTNLTDDTMDVSIAGEVAQTIDIGTNANADAVAAAIQAAVRALTAADDRNQEAYDSFLATYSAPTFATTLSTALANGVAVNEVTIVTAQGLKRGDTLRIQGPTADISVQIIDIFSTAAPGKRVQTATFTPGELVPAGSVVDRPDDFYLLTTGKRGADMTITVTDSAPSGADDLLLRDGDGIVRTLGTDQLGKQDFQFVAADFVAPAAATAAEIAAVLNRTLTGAQVNVAAGVATVVTDRVGDDASILVGGAAQSVLGFPATEQLGTETAVQLSLDSPEILFIQPFTTSTGALGALIGSPLSIVRVRRRNLVNISGADQSGGGTLSWQVHMRPGGRLEEV